MIRTTLSFFLSLAVFAIVSPAVAQNSAATDKTPRNQAIQKLAESWNAARDNSDIDAMLGLILPDERELARELIKPKAKGNSKVKIISITSAGDRLNVSLERSWGGQQPGKSKWLIQVSEFAGDWYVRFPGGDLKAPKNLALPVPASALSAPSEIAESSESTTASNAASKSSDRSATNRSTRITLTIAQDAMPYEQGKVSDSKAEVKTLAPTPPKPTPGVEKFQNWSRVCELNTKGQVDCFVEQIVTKSSNKQQFFIWRITPDGNGKIISNVITPNRVLLAYGVEMRFGREKPIKSAYRICNEKTCELSFGMDAAVIKTASENGAVFAEFTNHNNNKIEFEISLKGLLEAMTGI